MKHRLILFLLVWPSLLYAGSIDDKHALADLTSVKIVCDVNVGEAKLLLRRLELIDETYSQLLDAGVEPTIVVAFRGGASRFLTKGDASLNAEDAGAKREIQGWVDQFKQHGFRLEQCAIAAKAWKIDRGDFISTVTVVQNGYISLVAYQARGYSLLPMD
jgi:intracellular sulfur oxidation DsrE/DsrF family protein